MAESHPNGEDHRGAPRIARPIAPPRAVFACLAVLAMFMGYGSSYYHLSRRGVEEAPTFGLGGFTYVPAEQTRRGGGRLRNEALRLIFAPANWVDRFAFGGPDPARFPCWLELSG